MSESLYKRTAFPSLPRHVRFDPVPAGWEDLASEYEKWQETHAEDGSEFQDSRIALIREAASVLTKDVGHTIQADADYTLQVRDGSLILEIFITIPLIDLIDSAITEALHAAANNEDLTPWEAGGIIGKLIESMCALDRQVRKIASSLNEIIKAVIGRQNAIRPESRVGVIYNILQFHEKFSNGKNASFSVKKRARSMREALKQLKKVKMVIEKKGEADKNIMHSYLAIRARDLHGLPEAEQADDIEHIKAYNECVQEIHKIREELSSIQF